MAQGGDFNLNFLGLLISPVLLIYSAAGHVIRLFNPEFEKEFIGPDQHD